MTAKPAAVYRRRTYLWDALQWDGVNTATVIAFVGGPEFAEVVDDRIVLSLDGASPHSQKMDLLVGQWVMMPVRRARAFSVISEGEFNAVWEEDLQGPHTLPGP